MLAVQTISGELLGMQEYRYAKGGFPPPYVADTTGKPIHSWRELILPYLDQNDYVAFNNYYMARHFSTEIPVYACPSDAQACPGSGQTNYLAVAGPNTAWTAETPPKDSLAGKLAGTIMVVEVADSGIQWTEPRDLSIARVNVNYQSAPVSAVEQPPLSRFPFLHVSGQRRGKRGYVRR